VVPSRLAFLGLALLTASVGVAGCQYGNGSPCEQHADCASNFCCGFRASIRGVCQPLMSACVDSRDSGVSDASDVPDVPILDLDAPIDTGIDAPMDTGVDAPEDTGLDAADDDTGDDDAATDAGDTGIDVGT